MERLNPWGSELPRDTDFLFKDFGMQHFDEKLVERMPHPSRYFRRGVIYGHRDFDKWLAAHDKGKRISVMTGVKPTGDFHLGTYMAAELVVYLQKQFNAKVFYCVADLEAVADNGITLEEGHKNAIHNVADLLSLGLDPKKTVFYKQSTNQNVKNLAFMASRKVTVNMLEALYGHQNMGLYQSALMQIGDILQPQLEEFGGPQNVVVPVGVDQDPHLRLVRDIADKIDPKFIKPSSIYWRTFPSLDGSAKMSKRNPNNALSFNDAPKVAAKKVMSCKTGGRKTWEEQQRLGGEWWDCVNHDLAFFHFVDDDKYLKSFQERCQSGKISCGDCKKENAEKISTFLEDFQKQREKNVPRAKKILESGGE
ncbi:MAG TPA: tryptophan--tRNA ligase [Candidatus Norongarragalinales archaeon]|jgi:tryptophanyl-tRNA synthetase|nr:tryptophan--tRNA ligase [Candidatus Norongarragalinales archaeon]